MNQLGDSSSRCTRVMPTSFFCRQLQWLICRFSRWGIELGNLVAFHQVGIGIIFTVEFSVFGNGTIQSQCRHHCVFYGAFINDRQNTGHAEAHRTDMGIWRCIGIIGAATAEHLAFSIELRVHFQPDNSLIFHRCHCTCHRFSIPVNVGG